MKKTRVVLPLLILGLVFGAAQAHAVPAIDGLVGGVEWNNLSPNPYPYYLEVFDPQEAGIPDPYNIKRVVLLQELNSFPSGDGDLGGANDGIYLLIETYAQPPSLLDSNGFGQTALVTLGADFNGDGTINNDPDGAGGFPADLQIIMYNSVFNGNNPANDVVEVCVGAVQCIQGNAGNIILNPALYKRGPDAIEMFFPSGAFGTPFNTQFPSTFIGNIEYDNGGAFPDDIAFGQVIIPEPATGMLLGSGLLALVGFRRFRFDGK